MSFDGDNRAFEQWLASQCDVEKAGLRRKHKRMTKDPFTFLRATFFRWAGRIEAICPALTGAPAVLSVGDTHIENFGTWRDAEGRLVWGINDFDEAAVIPYPFDLVRLAASARLAPGRTIAMRDAAAAILAGYRLGLEEPRPTLLDEQETWMRPLVACTDADRARFWKDIDRYPDAAPPRAVAAGLRHALPRTARLERFATRLKGTGSLGRPRYVAIAHWRGGRIVREAKALVPSAWDWAHGRAPGRPRFYRLAHGKFRAPDPFLEVRDGFIFRRLAADARKVELPDETPVSVGLLAAMGFDIGAIHAADRRHAAVRGDLAGRDQDWLHKAAKAAAASIKADYKEWTR
jgi:Uncharacterized protein conserved in bacteria (DUF2252)